MKTSQLQIRVSPEQKARLRRLAARAGQDVSSYVLARALPAPPRLQFEAAVRALRDDEKRRYAFAEIADLLRADTLTALQIELEPAGVGGLSTLASNYLAALVEQACVERGAPIPAWTGAIAPLPTPWFASDFRSLRALLLTTSPPAFKRRNLFVDPGVAGRV